MPTESKQVWNPNRITEAPTELPPMLHDPRAEAHTKKRQLPQEHWWKISPEVLTLTHCTLWQCTDKSQLTAALHIPRLERLQSLPTLQEVINTSFKLKSRYWSPALLQCIYGKSSKRSPARGNHLMALPSHYSPSFQLWWQLFASCPKCSIFFPIPAVEECSTNQQHRLAPNRA